MDPENPDPEITALVRELLLAEELDLLTKAVLTFPDTLPAAFPSGGDVAAAKLALATHLKTHAKESLPDDAAFYTRLSRHALAATVSTQQDARVVRSLREDFGAAGLGRFPPVLPACRRPPPTIRRPCA